MIKKIGLLILIIGFCSSAFSAVVYNEWRGTTSDWNIGTNWNYGYVPKTVAENGDNVRAGFKGSSYVWPIITSSTIPIPEAYNVTLGGPTGGTLTIDSGALNVGQYFFIGVSAGENGTLNVNGGTITTGTFTSTNASFSIGQAGIGTVNMTGGIINLTANGATGQLRIANTSTATGKLNLNGGIIYADTLTMPFAAQGALDLGGGTLVLNGDVRSAINTLITNKHIIAYNDNGTVEVDYNIINPGKTTIRGYFADVKATNPSPANGAASLPTSSTLSWTAGNGAVSHNVYFGTASPGEYQGNQSETTFTPETLAYGNTYYWRIDEVNSVGTVATGDVWNFTTISGQATNPTPANDAINLPLDLTLSWTAGPGAESHNVYFGTASPGTLQSNQTATTFNPGALAANTTYFWRIDEVVGSEVVTGNVWSFTTAQSKAYNPTPANNAVNVSLGATLAWTAGGGAVSHDVYFGTVSPGDFKGNQTVITYLPGTLSANTTYYWRIDEKDSLDNTITGDIWSFTTGNPPTVYPYLTFRNSPLNSIVVNWWNPAVTGDSSVDYGLTSSYGSTATNASVTNFHSVELTDLTPGTTYHYRIRSSDGTIGSDNTFTTSAEDVTSFTFAVMGDPRGIILPNDSTKYHTRHKELCDWLAQQDLPFVINTGDIVWEGSILTSDPQTKINVESYWTEFFKAEQNLSQKTAVMISMGNHEVQPGGRDYTYYYDMVEDAYPTNGTSGNRGRVYSFDYGNAHFICLSTYQIALPTQAAWLEADLVAARANPNIKWIFAYMHAPMYTTSGHAGRADAIAAWEPLFDQYQVDIVFSGHNHLYERFKPLRGGQVVEEGKGVGTLYITHGIGGAEFNNGADDPKLVCWYGTSNLNKTLGLIITINGDNLMGQAIPNLTGIPVDTFQIAAPFLDGDYDENGSVDVKDLKIFSEGWLGTGLWP
ncbi:MAG: hypothetical protein A2Y10_00905 [Planctomycetes bacterium GWF2_41_51]|nr:MAG: hypothetical protein A2Y10_00905 [Planctomycetes bacterium GWF2_41_51]HBG28107.1 hypothetical protein [Phycisphaerales bacterium]